MKQAYRAIALLIALGVVVQASAIAFGWFQVIVDVEDGAAFTKDSEANAGHMIHGIVGMTVIPLLALLLLVSSFFTKVKGASKWAGFVLLAVVVQVTLAFVAFGVAAVGALHGMNALILLGLAVLTARRIPAGHTTSHVGGTTTAPQHSAVPQQSSTV
jgi:hypothetical protein